MNIINLKKEWNLISFKFDYLKISEIIALSSNNITKIYSFNKSYEKLYNNNENYEDKNLLSTKGYWIYSNENIEVDLSNIQIKNSLFLATHNNFNLKITEEYIINSINRFYPIKLIFNEEINSYQLWLQRDNNYVKNYNIAKYAIWDVYFKKNAVLINNNETKLSNKNISYLKEYPVFIKDGFYKVEVDFQTDNFNLNIFSNQIVNNFIDDIIDNTPTVPEGYRLNRKINVGNSSRSIIREYGSNFGNWYPIEYKKDIKDYIFYIKFKNNDSNKFTHWKTIIEDGIFNDISIYQETITEENYNNIQSKSDFNEIYLIYDVTLGNYYQIFDFIKITPKLVNKNYRVDSNKTSIQEGWVCYMTTIGSFQTNSLPSLHNNDRFLAERQLYGELKDPNDEFYMNESNLINNNIWQYSPIITQKVSFASGIKKNYVNENYPNVNGWASNNYKNNYSGLVSEFICYVYFLKGFITLGLTNDDCFDISIGPNFRSGHFDHYIIGKQYENHNFWVSSTVTWFHINIEEEGYYPVRVISYSTTDDGFIEIYHIDDEGNQHLLGDKSDPDSLKCYIPVNFIEEIKTNLFENHRSYIKSVNPDKNKIQLKKTGEDNNNTFEVENSFFKVQIPEIDYTKIEIEFIKKDTIINNFILKLDDNIIKYEKIEDDNKLRLVHNIDSLSIGNHIVKLLYKEDELDMDFIYDFNYSLLKIIDQPRSVKMLSSNNNTGEIIISVNDEPTDVEWYLRGEKIDGGVIEGNQVKLNVTYNGRNQGYYHAIISKENDTIESRKIFLFLSDNN